MPYAYIQKLTLIFTLFAFHRSYCLYQPTALLFAHTEENKWKDDSHSLDPIISELSINIQQEYTPIIASRQLVHRLVRYQEQVKKDVLNPNTKMHELFDHLAKRQLGNNKNFWEKPDISYTLHKAQQEAPSKKLPPDMLQFVTNHPQIIAYFLAANTPIHSWHIHQVKNKKTQKDEPFYILLPPSMPTFCHKHKKNASITLKPIPFSTIHAQALSESASSQSADYCTISGELVTNMLKALRRKISPLESPCTFILGLTGHGRYTRSQFGKASDRIKPKNFESLPTPDQCDREAQGDPLGSIAGLHVSELTSLITRLDQDALTAFFYYDTCYSGNQHLVLPYLQKDGTPLQLSYPIVSRCVDSGTSCLAHSELGITSDDTLRLTCPTDPKTFFEKIIDWCHLSAEKQKQKSLRSAFLAMIGDRIQNNVSMRESMATTFVPLLAKNHRCITHQNANKPEQLLFKKKEYQLFLDHNVISRPIITKAPLIRSSVPTNCTHYLNSLECTDHKNRPPLDFIAHLFFHEHTKSAVNRVIFFIKTLKLITQDKPHLFHDVLIMHHAIWQDNKNSFALWRNPKKTLARKSTYTIGYARPANKTLENVHNITPLEAHTTLLYYLKLKSGQLSYIEAPALHIAAPHAFDDTPIKEFCEKKHQEKKCTLKTTRKIWQLLGW